MTAGTIKRRDALKPWLAFRDAATLRRVGRWFALLHPRTTMSERRKHK